MTDSGALAEPGVGWMGRLMLGFVRSRGWLITLEQRASRVAELETSLATLSQARDALAAQLERTTKEHESREAHLVRRDAALEHELAENKRKLQALEKEVTLRRDEDREQAGKLRELRDASERTERALRSRVDKLERELKDRERELGSLTTSARAVQQQNATAVEARVVELLAVRKRLEHELSERDRTLAKLEAELAERDGNLLSLRAVVSTKDESTEALSADLLHARRELETAQRLLAEAIGTRDALNLELERRQAELSKLSSERDASRREAAELQGRDKERDERLLALETALEEREALVAELEKAVAAQRAAIAKRDAMLTERRSVPPTG